MFHFLLHALLEVPSLFTGISPRLWVFGYGVSIELIVFICWLLQRKGEKTGRVRMTCLCVMVLYLVFAFLITTISRRPFGKYQYELIPFKAYYLIFRGSWFKCKEVLYNYCLLLPLGFLLPPVLDFHCSWKDILLLSFMYTLAVESTQLIFKLGWFEIDDNLHNCLGALIGYCLVCLCRMLLRRTGLQVHKEEPE